MTDTADPNDDLVASRDQKRGRTHPSSRRTLSRSEIELLRDFTEEFGFYPASVEPEDVERTRAELAEHDRWVERAKASSLTPKQLAHRYAHLRRWAARR
jgi:hypothetical protein